jgi:FkbM family methyltransferase
VPNCKDIRFLFAVLKKQAKRLYSFSLLAMTTDVSYKSQFGQDQWLNDRVFHKKKNGVFVEVGAHNGIAFSNSYYFEKALGWSGLCVEPILDRFVDLQSNRTCRCVFGCAFNREGKVTFNRVTGYAEMLSGINNEYDPRHLKRVVGELRAHGGSASVVDVPCYTLSRLFTDYGLRTIDYLSIDTEGSELGVLQGIDFQRANIHVIGVEDNYPDRFGPVKDFLQARGFEMREKVGCDCMFVNTNWVEETTEEKSTT